jgi:hypothetical protein
MDQEEFYDDDDDDDDDEDEMDQERKAEQAKVPDLIHVSW